MLAALIRFKQLCNHPDQEMRMGAFKPEESGEFLFLQNLAQKLKDNAEKMLVFMQYRSIIPELDTLLELVILTGNKRNLCTTRWGSKWRENLELFADYGNRLDRSKRYVCSGAVIDLKFRKREVIAKVQGSGARPYKVTIRIDPLTPKEVNALMDRCSRKVSSLESFVNGEFPADMEELFTSQGGLFPRPRQIHFDCSCPDWAVMCKHVAAVMYSIGVRLYENPFCFF